MCGLINGTDEVNDEYGFWIEGNEAMVEIDDFSKISNYLVEENNCVHLKKDLNKIKSTRHNKNNDFNCLQLTLMLIPIITLEEEPFCFCYVEFTCIHSDVVDF